MERSLKALQSAGKTDKMLTVRNGYLVCPTCRRNKRLLKIEPNTVATDLVVFCRDCKTEHRVNISQGQCYESRSQ